MPSSPRTPPASGSFSRRFAAYAGLFFDDFDANSAWIRQSADLRLPPLDGVGSLILRGQARAHPNAQGMETAAPGLRAYVNGQLAGVIGDGSSGPWELRIPLPAAE